MIVRLKVNRSIFLLRKQIRFNSMIVRLKDLVQVGIHKFVVFQFYDSPIKRVLLYIKHIESYKVSIL